MRRALVVAVLALATIGTGPAQAATPQPASIKAFENDDTTVTTAPALTSTGDDEQWVTIPIPDGGWVALLDNNQEPVTATTFRGQGTYTLDPAAGHISFQPYHHFYGLARAATYQLTYADGHYVRGTYQATVNPRAIPAVRVGKRTLTSADGGTARLGCTAGPLAVDHCTITVTALVNNEQVTLASGTAANPTPGRVGTLNLDVTVTDQGRRLSGVPGGWPTQVTASIWLPGASEPLTATDDTKFTALTVTAPRPIRYDAGGSDIPDADLPYLNALRSRMADVTTVTCTGGSDGQGTPTANEQVALARAQHVCDYLGARTKAKIVVKTATPTGQTGAENRRTDIVFDYTPTTTDQAS